MNRDVKIQVRVRQDEKDAWEEEARARGLSLSEFIRTRVDQNVIVDFVLAKIVEGDADDLEKYIKTLGNVQELLRVMLESARREARYRRLYE